jgi:selenocysteine lyase/cysteine desulfurase
MLSSTYILALTCHTGEGVLLHCLQIILSVAEHHGNLVPWQLLAARSGAVLRFVPLTQDKSELDMAVCLGMLHCLPA